MSADMFEKKFTVVATRCGNCGCGCPTIFESDDGENLVIIGVADPMTAGAAAIREKIGAGEAAVMIPRSLLIEAAKRLA